VRVPPVTDTAPKSSGVALSVKSPVPVKVIVPAPFVNVPADESQLPPTFIAAAPATNVPANVRSPVIVMPYVLVSMVVPAYESSKLATVTLAVSIVTVPPEYVSKCTLVVVPGRLSAEGEPLVSDDQWPAALDQTPVPPTQ